LNGYGIWALVANNLISAGISPILLWFTIKWRPTLAFSWKRMKVMYSFGWKLLLSSFILRAYLELRALIIGRLYTPGDLGYYKKGESFPALITESFTKTIGNVLFPAIAQRQKDIGSVKNMTKKSMQTISYIILPIMAGLAVCAEPLVLFLLTDKWIAAVPFLQIACFFSAAQPIHNANLQAIRALGRSDIILRLEIIKRIISTTILLLVMRYGVLAIALSSIPATIIALILNAIPNIKLINYGLKEQLLDILPPLALSAVMAAAIYPVHFIGLSPLPTLCLQVAGGIIIYILISILFKVKSFYFILDTARQFLKKK